MKRLKHLALAAAIALPLAAEPVMRIHLTGQVSEQKIAEISTMTFSETVINVDGTPVPIAAIEKITFYDDGTEAVLKATGQSAGRIGFSLSGKSMQLSFADAEKARVDLYSIKGQHLATLHDGPVSAEALRFDLSNLALAQGVYTCVARVNNQLFVRKMLLK